MTEQQRFKALKETQARFTRASLRGLLLAAALLLPVCISDVARADSAVLSSPEKIRALDIHGLSLWQRYADVRDAMDWQIRTKPWDAREGVARKGLPVAFAARHYELNIGHALDEEGEFPGLLFEIHYRQIFRNQPAFEDVMERLMQRYGPPDERRFRNNRVMLLWGGKFPNLSAGRVGMPEDGAWLYAEIRNNDGMVPEMELTLADRRLEAAIRQAAKDEAARSPEPRPGQYVPEPAQNSPDAMAF